jgi:segregation and condensation protein B
MSLKAKLEAVVYAAEEPVTLSQLVTIFSEEVLQALDEAAVQEAAAQEAANREATTEEAPEALTGEPSQELQAEPASPEESAAQEAPQPETAEPVAAETQPEPEGITAEAAQEDEKKSARLRDRRVRQVLETALNELIADYANSERGMEIREIAGGYRMATKPEYHDAVRGFVKSLKPPMKLSLQALETLAVIAYKQPVTAPEVSEIRGVDSGGVLGGLVSRKLITTAGRKPVIGRPILYKTTKEFLLRFGLKDVNDLPSMEEFEKMAGELAESEAEGEAQDDAIVQEGAAPPETELVPGENAEAEVKAEATEVEAGSEPAPAEEAIAEVEPEADPYLAEEATAEVEAEAEANPETTDAELKTEEEHVPAGES